MTLEEKLLKTAAAELGTARIAGKEHNPRILQYADECGLGWINDDETPWCSIFANWVATKCGATRSKRAAARSWLDVGDNVVHDLRPGYVAVLWRGVGSHSPFGHVGFVLGFSKSGGLWLLGGNQSGAVTIAEFSTARVLGYRKLHQE